MYKFRVHCPVIAKDGPFPGKIPAVLS